MKGNGKPGKRSSVVFLCGISTKGSVEPVSSLFGRKVHSVAGGDAAMIALADDGIYTAPDGLLLSCLEFGCAAVGKSVIVGVTQSGSLYSWGTGDMGELGLGPAYTTVEEPKYINYGSTFASVSSGATHCAALDVKGNAYAWGQNFDRQLGLYTKPLDEMQKLRQNSLVEDLLFTPRFLPFSLQMPVLKIACGDAFTVAVTKDGALLSWGAGECGQLGTGRCTKRELPQQVALPTNTKVVDVACGAAHVVALASSSKVWVWGMNKRGQLGVDDTKTRHEPTEMTESALSECAKVFAHGNSSAAIDTAGQLYTWGSTSNHRLMRWRRRRSVDETFGSDAVGGAGSQHCLRPGHVAAFRGMCVETFSFSATASACLVFTNIQGLSPLLGPCKGAQQLALRGSGLWDSDRIVVKFTHKEGLGQSRACPGRFDVSQGAVLCRPPRLVDAGFYDVSIAMDGLCFQPEVHAFYAHKDIAATAVSPRLIDLRVSAQGGGSSVVTTVRGLSVYPDPAEGEMADPNGPTYWPRESDLRVFVKLLVLVSPPGAANATSKEVVVEGRLLPLPLLEMSSVLDGGSEGLPAGAFSSLNLGNSVSQASLESVELAEDSQQQLAQSSILKPISADRSVECIVNFASLGPPGSLLVIRTAVGLNGQDFGPATPELAPIICHSFQPVGAAPCCCPAALCEDLSPWAAASSGASFSESTSREITVVGNSFIPTTKLPPGTTIEAVVSAEVPKKGSKVPTRYERTVPVSCEAADSLTFVMPTLAEMLDPSVPLDPSGGNASRPATGVGVGVAPGGNGTSLSRPSSQERLADSAGESRPPSRAGSVKSVPGGLLTELLCKVMFKMVSPAPPTPSLPDPKGKGAKSPTKKDKGLPEPVPFLSPEAVSVFLYAPQGISVDPTLTRREGGATLVLQGARKGGFSFSSSDVRVVFSRPDLGLYLVSPPEQTWMLGLGDEVPVAAARGDGEGEGEGEGGDAAGGEGEEGAELAAGSVGSLGGASLGELSVKSTGSVVANIGQPQKIVLRCLPLYFPPPAPAPVAGASDGSNEGEDQGQSQGPTLQLDTLSFQGQGSDDEGSVQAVSVVGGAGEEGSEEAKSVDRRAGEGSREGEAEAESKDANAGVAEGGAEPGPDALAEGEADAAVEAPAPPLLPTKLDWVWVKVYLDGRSVVPDDEGFRLSLFSGLQLSSEVLAVPKGGALAGTPVVVPVVGGMVESARCVVRLRGAGSSAVSAPIPGTVTLEAASVPTAVATEGEADAENSATGATEVPGGYVDTGGSAGTVGFVLPDPATLGIEPEVKGKDRFLFADVSLDGGETWAMSEEALLQIK